jgi:hypothetical protein
MVDMKAVDPKARYYLFLAESHLTQRLFGNILKGIAAVPFG